MRDLGQEISGPGVQNQPVPEPSTSSASRQLATRALATSKLIPTNFFAPGSLRCPAAGRSRVRRATPSGRSRGPGSHVQSPFIPFGHGTALRRAPSLRAPLRDLGKAGLSSGSAPAPGEGWTGQRAGGRASDIPAHPPSHARSQRGKKEMRAERSSVPTQPGREAGAPPLRHQEPFAPQVKRESEFFAKNFLKLRETAVAGKY